MRAKDLLMAATIDIENRIIMVSGGIDVNEHAIVMRVPIPQPGLWTLIKAEVNLTDEAWTVWQIGLGPGVSLPKDPSQRLFLSRQFRKCEYIVERSAILFYDGEVRPGDAIFKIARLEIAGAELCLTHHRRTDQETEKAVKYGFGDDLPKIEVVTPVRIAQSKHSIATDFEKVPVPAV